MNTTTQKKRTEIAINAPATPIFIRRIIKMMDGKSFASSVVDVVAALVVSTFIDPIGDGAAAAGAGAEASLPPCNQDGVSAIVTLYLELLL